MNEDRPADTLPGHDFASMTLTDFLARCAEKSPVPGGGAGCAVIGAIGAAFGAMAARYSEPKDPAPEDSAVTNSIRALDIARAALLDLAGADATAYAGFDRARKLPKSTATEAAVRAHALARAAQEAATIPLQTMRTCVDALAALERVAPSLNPRLASDVGVCAIALKAALRGSMLNVEVNLAALPREVAEPLRKEAAALLDRGEWSAQAGLAEAKAALRGDQR